MTERYENVSIAKEEAETLKEIEKLFGIAIPNIEKINWDEYEIDENTHQIERIKQHQFGFVAENNHVIALGLSLKSLNVKSLKVPDKLPEISKFTFLENLDFNHWDDFFSEYTQEIKRREEIQRSLTNPQLDTRIYRTMEERIQARREENLKKTLELKATINAPSPSRLFTELEKLENLKILDLSECGLSQSMYGSSISGLKNLKKLQVLDLSKNTISEMPEEIGSLDTLETIILRGNPIKKYPITLDHAKFLKKLDIFDTNIEELPDSIGNHAILEEILLPVGIIEFPDSFVNLRNLKLLIASNVPKQLKDYKNLERFQLNNYKQEELPVSLTELSQLETLEINDCRALVKLPENIGNLRSLKTLIIKGSKSLKTLPSSIFNLKSLRTLNLYNNNLTDLYDRFGDFLNLEILNLSNNQIKYLPYSIYKLNNLIDFTIDNNPLEKNDALISKKTLPEIKQYCKKKVAINVFISHAVADFEPCNIQKISEYLESQLEIEQSFYCERDLSGNIDTFMDQNIPQSQLILFIGTPRSIASRDCQYELKLSKEYNVELIPIKSKELNWADLGKLGLSRELGIECDFSNKEEFLEFLENLYDYIKQIKRQIDLHDKEKGKIDRLTIGLKAIERQLENLDKRVKLLEEKMND